MNSDTTQLDKALSLRDALTSSPPKQATRTHSPDSTPKSKQQSPCRLVDQNEVKAGDEAQTSSHLDPAAKPFNPIDLPARSSKLPLAQAYQTSAAQTPSRDNPEQVPSEVSERLDYQVRAMKAQHQYIQNLQRANMALKSKIKQLEEIAERDADFDFSKLSMTQQPPQTSKPETEAKPASWAGPSRVTTQDDLEHDDEPIQEFEMMPIGRIEEVSRQESRHSRRKTSQGRDHHWEDRNRVYHPPGGGNWDQRPQPQPWRDDNPRREANFHWGDGPQQESRAYERQGYNRQNHQWGSGQTKKWQGSGDPHYDSHRGGPARNQPKNFRGGQRNGNMRAFNQWDDEPGYSQHHVQSRYEGPPHMQQAFSDGAHRKVYYDQSSQAIRARKPQWNNANGAPREVPCHNDQENFDHQNGYGSRGGFKSRGGAGGGRGRHGQQRGCGRMQGRANADDRWPNDKADAWAGCEVPASGNRDDSERRDRTRPQQEDSWGSGAQGSRPRKGNKRISAWDNAAWHDNSCQAEVADQDCVYDATFAQIGESLGEPRGFLKEVCQKSQDFEIVRLKTRGEAGPTQDDSVQEFMISSKVPHADKHFFVEEEFKDVDEAAERTCDQVIGHQLEASRQDGCSIEVLEEAKQASPPPADWREKPSTRQSLLEDFGISKTRLGDADSDEGGELGAGAYPNSLDHSDVRVQIQRAMEDHDEVALGVAVDVARELGPDYPHPKELDRAEAFLYDIMQAEHAQKPTPAPPTK